MVKKIEVNKIEFKVDGQYVVVKLPIELTKKEALVEARKLYPSYEFTRQWVGKEEEELRVQSPRVSQSEFVESILKPKNVKNILLDGVPEDGVFSEYEEV